MAPPDFGRLVKHISTRVDRLYSPKCNKELFDKKQIDIKEPFPVTKCQFTL